MKVLVTGGAGFIGAVLVEKLLEKGRDVTVFDNLSSGSKENVPEEAGFVEGDVKNQEELEEVIDESFDRVYHLAAARDVSIQEEDRETDVEENIYGTHNVLEAMLENGVKDIIFTSTSTVYGEADEFPTPEHYSPLEPISLYGASKLSAENLISVYSHSFGFKATVLRLANIIGESSDHGVTYDFVKKLEEDDSSLFVLGNGEQRKSYLHIDNCVDATITAVENRKEDFEVLNVGNTDSVSVTKIAEAVIDEFRCDADIEYEGGKKGWSGDVTEMLLSIEKLKEKGWEPKMSSEEAVRRTARGVIQD